MLDQILNMLKQVFNWVLSLLPDSPIQAVSNSPVAQYLPYVNWFIPISFMLSTAEAWLTAIAVYYAISAIMRWVKAVS